MVALISFGWCFDTVEQLLYDMVRNCRDQVRARTPQKFSTLFKVILMRLLHAYYQTHVIGLLVNQ